MSDVHTLNKAAIEPLRSAMFDFAEGPVRKALLDLMDPDAVVHLFHPVGDLVGPDALYDRAYAPLFSAIPDLERRDWIVIGGQTENGSYWIGCAGHYVGTFVAPWLDIPPTGHLAHIRFHEFFRFEDGKAVEVQALWDIPEIMLQARAWPMAPSLGLEFCIPGPASQDGIVTGPYDPHAARQSCDLVLDMVRHMQRHPSQGGPEVMNLPEFWHPNLTWYGPAGIGTARGIAGFRNWHQIPFLTAMPDRGQHREEVTFHFFGDRNYVGVTGWPNMIQTVSHDGWMGIAPSGKRISMRSLDFWRIRDGRIRENWVMLDILDIYLQLGVDVLARLREFNKARVPGSVPFPVGAA